MQTRWINLAIATSIGALAAGCAANRQTSAAGPQSSHADREIVRLVGRHDTIIVTAGRAGPLYSVSDPNGKILIADATLDELRDAHPASYKQIKSALVDGDPEIWAGTEI